mmetsp:Transcript_53928/g.127431  ORF Transcript_53928/g.127431 Transcript_53928/m.127431 type:complete len:360 (-) Transcript_53928:76-1155(-)
MSWDPAEQHRPRRSLRFRHRNAAPSLGHRLCMECTVAIRDPQNALMQSVKCCMALSVCPPLSRARALSRCQHASLARNAADAPLAHRRCHPGVPRPNLGLEQEVVGGLEPFGCTQYAEHSQVRQVRRGTAHEVLLLESSHPLVDAGSEGLALVADVVLLLDLALSKPHGSSANPLVGDFVHHIEARHVVDVSESLVRLLEGAREVGEEQHCEFLISPDHPLLDLFVLGRGCYCTCTLALVLREELEEVLEDDRRVGYHLLADLCDGHFAVLEPGVSFWELGGELELLLGERVHVDGTVFDVAVVEHCLQLVTERTDLVLVHRDRDSFQRCLPGRNNRAREMSTSENPSDVPPRTRISFV